MKRTIKSESGRSMVEMLGVLAIIGVLSVGGIAGYTMAMNRYRANDVIDMANKVAALAFAQNQTSLARTGAALSDDAVAAITPLSLGLIPNSANNNGGNMPGGGSVTVDEITEDQVEMTLEFPTEGVCTAGFNILAQGTNSCATDNDHKVTAVIFRQS